MNTNKNILNTALLAALFLALLPGIATAQEMKTLHGHVPAAISKLDLQPTGQLPDETTMNLAIGLPLRNTGTLSNLLQQIYDPSGPNYHHYLTPDQFTEQFGPSEQDYQTVIDFAKANGLVVVGTHPNRMILDVRGRAADVEKAFRVTLQNYHQPTDNRDFFAPDVDPSVPATLPIQDIAGLDNSRIPHSRYKLKAAVSGGGTSKATTGSGPDGNYIGNDFRNAYVPGSPLNGSGQTVALVEFDGYLASDITEYEGMAGRTNIPLQNVLLDGFTGAPTGDGGEVEVSLDIQMLVSIAPALANIVVYEGNPFDFFPNDVLNRIATDNTARQISCSWGWSGGPSATTDNIFQEMALQGQTFYDAVGDSDAFTAGANSVNGVDNPFLPNQPSDSPYITQVGGTTLTMSSAGSSYSSETVWNWDIRYGPDFDGVGSCGGISSYYPIPSWQTNVSMALNQGSTTFRNMPDVALTADDIFVIADGGVFYPGTGGTSCAAPLWAGFTALVNQQATNSDLPPVGFINPALYAIGNSANYTNCFHDVAVGNNTWSQSPTMFYAVSNYDLCSGLGTPSGTNLINALTGISSTNGTPFTHLSAPLPPYGTTMSAMNGGNPNGNWYLFVEDDQTFNFGLISNGWSITLTSANPVGFVADDYLGMTASQTNVPLSADVSFNIGVTNYGPSTSSNVVVSDSFPAGFTYVSSSISQGKILPGGASLSWVVSNLTINASAQMSLTLQAPSTPEQDVNNLASVSANTPDQNPADGSAYVTLNAVSVSQPAISSGINANGQFQIVVNSPSVLTVIQSSTNLINWVNLYTNTPPFTNTISVKAGTPYQFYRAVLQ
jgi:uncharacterized repeat protein (TIGR01451 family)